MAFDGKKLYRSAMVDNISCTPRVETLYLFIRNKDLELFQQFNNRTLTQSKDQASAFSSVMYYHPKNLTFQHFPVKQDVFVDGQI